MYHRDAVGLAKVGCHLSQKLIERHPCRSRELQFGANFLPDALRNVNSQLYVQFVLRNV